MRITLVEKSFLFVYFVGWVQYATTSQGSSRMFPFLTVVSRNQTNGIVFSSCSMHTMTESDRETCSGSFFKPPQLLNPTPSLRLSTIWLIEGSQHQKKKRRFQGTCSPKDERFFSAWKTPIFDVCGTWRCKHNDNHFPMCQR